MQNNDWEQKGQTQINRSSFKWLEKNAGQNFDIQINKWILKWHRSKVLNDKWKVYNTTHNSRPGEIYENIKVINSGFNTAVVKNYFLE